MSSRSLKQIDRAVRVNIEVVQGPRRGQVVAGLGSSMNNQYGLQFRNNFANPNPIANIRFYMMKIAVGFHESSLIPACVSLRTKEIRSHVVVNSMDLPTKRTKIGDDL